MAFEREKKYIFLSVILVLFFSSESWAISFNSAGIRMRKDVKSLKELRQENVVTQSLDFSCGAAGLSTLLNFYLNEPLSEPEIITELLQTVPLEKVQERQGFSLYDLKKYAEGKGFKVTGYQMDFEFLQKLGKPILVPIKFKNYRHFVVVKAVYGDRVFIADPAMGNMIMKDEKFMSMWSNGIGFLVEHTDQADALKNYALKVDSEDVRMVDYDLLKRISLINQVRTAIFPNEW